MPDICNGRDLSTPARHCIEKSCSVCTFDYLSADVGVMVCYVMLCYCYVFAKTDFVVVVVVVVAAAAAATAFVVAVINSFSMHLVNPVGRKQTRLRR